MPTYSYACDACKHRFDAFQSIKDKPIRKCPQCGKLKVRRLITGGGGLLFKGSGFYQTDYRSKGYQEAAKKDSPQKDPPKESSPKSDASSSPTSPKQK